MVDLVEQFRQAVEKKYSRETLETMLTWAADEIERLRGIRHAAILVSAAVTQTHDHTQWFRSLAELMTAVSMSSTHRETPP